MKGIKKWPVVSLRLSSHEYNLVKIYSVYFNYQDYEMTNLPRVAKDFQGLTEPPVLTVWISMVVPMTTPFRLSVT